MKVNKNLTIYLLASLLFSAGACTPKTQTVSEASAAQPTQPHDAGITILAFGNSLTEGLGVDPQESYPAQLERKLEADGYNVKVINGGISGETTTSALSRVDWMLNTNPDIVIVETGANDALRGIDLEITQDNLDEIVRRFTDSGAVVIVAGLQIIQNLGQEYTTGFAELYPAVAEKYGSILIPFILEGVAADPELNQADYIHPTADGYKVLVEHIYPFVLQGIVKVNEKK